LVFDLDGTLVDSAPAILACLEAVVVEAGFAPVVSIGPHLIGPPLKATLARIAGVDDGVVLEALAKDFKHRYDAEVALITHPFPGVSDALSQLYENCQGLHLATNKRSLPTRKILQAQGWERYFKSVYSQDSIPAGYASKSDMLQRLLQEQSINPERTVYIGDTREDGVAAQANGMTFVAVTWGYGGDTDVWSLAQPWHKIAMPDDLKNLGDFFADASAG
jgi:phosphoglycolate phosphatase